MKLMRKFICFFLGHSPKIQLVRIYTFHFDNGEYIRKDDKLFPVVAASCWCERCGKFMARKIEEI